MTSGDDKLTLYDNDTQSAMIASEHAQRHYGIGESEQTSQVSMIELIQDCLLAGRPAGRLSGNLFSQHIKTKLSRGLRTAFRPQPAGPAGGWIFDFGPPALGGSVINACLLYNYWF